MQVRHHLRNFSEIIYKDKPFTGEVWTKDGKSAVFVVSDGRPVKATLFHDNGEPAMIVTLKSGEKDKKYYDINGYEMKRSDWKTKYRDISDKRRLIDEEFPLK